MKWTRAGQVAALLDGLVDLDALHDLPPAEAFAVLRATDLAQATRFLAQCLPPMEALRWVAACLHAMPAAEAPARSAATRAVSRWLDDPSDANRRIAHEVGQVAGWASAEGAACLAVFLSGGSLAPSSPAQPVHQGPGAFGQAVAGAVLMAAFGAGAGRFERRLAIYVDLGATAATGEPLPG